MSVETFEVSNVGQIVHASVALKDFTVIVGPQATGKSVFLQLFKLAIDHQSIERELKDYSFDWGEDRKKFFELYLGEGASGMFRKTSKARWEDKESDLLDNFFSTKPRALERVFYIPAQRVLAIEGGWPKNYRSFEYLDPFVVKHFSETLRLMADKEISESGSVFPLDNRFDSIFSDLISATVYNGAEVKLDKESPKRRLLIDLKSSQIPFMGWSAGQREFTPLLLSMLWLIPKLPPANTAFDRSLDFGEMEPGEGFATLKAKYLRKNAIKYVVLEEPEMGLHPDAIKVVIALIMLLHLRGYKVILSTHSPVFLEFFWALKELGGSSIDSEAGINGVDSLLKLIGLPSAYQSLVWSVAAKKDSFGAYFFDRTNDGVVSRDISSLDPGSDDEAIAAWGRLTDFSSKVSEIVSQAHA